MTTAGGLISEYLQRLYRIAADLPEGARTELYEDIRAHLADTLAPNADETTVREVLDELGSPEEIVAAAASENDTGRGAVRRRHGAGAAARRLRDPALWMGGRDRDALGRAPVGTPAEMEWHAAVAGRDRGRRAGPPGESRNPGTAGGPGPDRGGSGPCRTRQRVCLAAPHRR